MILAIGSNSKILKSFLLSKNRDSFIGVDMNNSIFTDIELDNLSVHHKQIIKFLKNKNIKIASIILAARNKHVENISKLIDEIEICKLTKFYWNLISSLCKENLVTSGLKIFFLNSTNGRLVSQQGFSYHANCAILDIFSKYIKNKIFEQYSLKCAVINFQIGIVKLPTGNLDQVSKTFENVYGQGNIINEEILKNTLEINLKDDSFLNGYREVRIGIDPAFDNFYSTKLLLD